MRRLLAALALLAAVAASPARAADPVKVVASFSVLGDMVREIGGSHVAVTTLVGANGDAHVFQPRPADAKALAAADLVVVNGLGLEGWIDRLIKSAGYRGPVAVATTGVHPRTGDPGEGEHGADPHAWQDVANAGIYAANITQALSKAAPDLAPVFHEAGDAYRRRLADLDREVRASFATVPPERRRIITSHDAFGYYGAAYGLTLLAPQGLSTESEPSAGSVAKLIRQIRTTGVKAIFIENVTDPRLMQRIARESGAVVGGELYSDALSGPDGPAATYIDMVRHNTRSIVAALSGKG